MNLVRHSNSNMLTRDQLVGVNSVTLAQGRVLPRIYRVVYEI